MTVNNQVRAASEDKAPPPAASLRCFLKTRFSLQLKRETEAKASPAAEGRDQLSEDRD